MRGHDMIFGGSRGAHHRRASLSGAENENRSVSSSFSTSFLIEGLETRFLLSDFLSTFAPTLPKVIRPSDNPALPSEFDRFIPPGRTGRANSSAPDIGEWTKTGGPGDTLVITADQLSKFTGGSAGSDTEFVAYGQTRLRQGILKDAVVKRVDGQFASVELDSLLPDRSMYFLWPKNADGYGDPVTVNRTEVWWVGPNRADAGETISVFGRNLSHDGGMTSAWVYVKAVGAAEGQWTQVTAANPYKVDFVVPAGLAPGTYEAWAHNGHGGNYGWAAPVTFVVKGDGKWDGPVYNVKDFGAKGDGIADDYPAIAKVMQKAGNNPRSTIYLPAGTYRISDGFRGTPADVRWTGAGKSATILKPVDNYDRWALFFDDIGADTEIRDMTLDAIDAAPLALRILARTGDTHDVRFVNMAFYGPNAELDLNLALSKRVFIKNSEILGRGIHVSNASQVFIDAVNFYGTNDAGQLIWADGGNQISVSNSTARDYDNSDPNSGRGWAQGRLYVGQGLGGSQSQVYIGGNTTYEMGVRPGVPEQNSGEQLLFELNRTQFTARPASTTLRTVTFARVDKIEGDRVTIVGGRGVGQYRRILSFDRLTGTIILDKPWNVIPDSRSMISVGYLADRVVVYNNHFDGKAAQVSAASHTASSGVNMFGASADFVVANNVMTDVRFGIYNWMPEFGVEHTPFFSNLFTSNAIFNTREGFSIHAAGIGDGAVAYHSNIYRENLINGIYSYGVYMRAFGHGTDANMNVFEGNIFLNTPVGIRMQRDRGEMENTIFERNRFDRGSATLLWSRGAILFSYLDPLIMDQTIRRPNTFNGFSEDEVHWGVL
jgi:hypothetical protein